MGLSESGIGVGNDTLKWRYMKKQVMESLKQHGDGRKHLEDMTLKYGDEMLTKMEDYSGQPFDPQKILVATVASVMLTLIYGHTTEEDAKKFIHCEEQVNKVLQPNSAYLMLDMLPILRFIIPSVKKAFAEFMTVIKNAISLYDGITASRRKLYKHPKVEFVIDHFLKLSMINQIEDDKSKIVNDADIRSVGIDVFGAGITTTSKTLQMMLAVFVNHPAIQEKAHKEIVEAIGNRKPKIEDKISMPFIEALILETLRYHSLLMLAIPHQARCNTDINGYFIPRGTFIFPNLWALHHDEKYWDQPWQFNPNRFIENGKVVAPDHKTKQRFLAFGAGRRKCAGEVFAKNRLFILTCLMLQKFKFVPAEGHPLPNHDPRDCSADFTLLMREYDLSVELRQ